MNDWRQGLWLALIVFALILLAAACIAIILPPGLETP